MPLFVRCWAALVLAAWAPARADEDADKWRAFSQHGYSHDEKPKGDVPMVVVLALRMRNLDFLEESARSISDPGAPQYAQYFSRAEISSVSGPADAHVEAVTRWLDGRGGLTRFSFGHDFARFLCNVSCVEHVFGTKLLMQKGPLRPGQSRFRAATPIKLPDSVAEALDGVSLNAPIFMPPRPPKREPQKFVYPLSGRRAPRFHPEAIAGDEFLTLRFVAYCMNGKANDRFVERGICAGPPDGAQHGTPAGNTIVSFEILLMQDPQMQKVVQLPATLGVLGQRRARCAEVVGVDPLELANDDEECVEFNVTLGSVQNYARTTAQIRAHFGDGTVTLFSDLSELPATWPNPYTTPELLARTYGIPLNKPITHPRNAISVAEFLGQYYNPQDLETFFRLTGVRSWSSPDRTNPITIGRDLPIAGSVLGGESQLDLQYIMALAANVTTWFWSVPGTELATLQEPFLDWLMQLSDTPDDTIPLVHSVSYGDDELTMPGWFKRRVNAEFMKLGMRGVSVLVASGDDGVSGYQVSQKGVAFCDRARPEFPASSPWVTTVGGTQLAATSSPICAYTTDRVVVNCLQIGEVMCDSSTGGGITSGGGFSYFNERPWYQQEAVEGYLAQTDNPVPPSNGDWHFNPAGRAYPDVAALAASYLVWMGDQFVIESGTSASTPVLAAMVAHWNEARLQQGRPPLGFLNPLIYRVAARHPEAFSDILMGKNGCSRDNCCNTSFHASRGWDAISGFGSPKFEVLLNLLRTDDELNGGWGVTQPAAPQVAAAAEEGSRSWLRPGAPAAGGPGAAAAAVPLAAVPLALLVGAALGASAVRGGWTRRWWAAPLPLRADLLSS